MFDPATGVVAYIMPFDSDQPYAEYVAPCGLESLDDDSIDAYIAAVTDERFKMVITLPANFDFKGSPAIQVRFSVFAGGVAKDVRTGEWVCCSHIFERQEGRTAPYVFIASVFIARIPDADDFSSYAFCFGPVELTGIALSARLLTQALRSRSKISVEVDYGKPGPKEKVSTQMNASGVQHLPTNKAIATDHGRSHTLLPLKLGEVDQPQATRSFDRDWKKGSVDFTFCYVSQQYLELKDFVQVNHTPAAAPQGAPMPTPALQAPVSKPGSRPSMAQRSKAAPGVKRSSDSLDSTGPNREQGINAETLGQRDRISSTNSGSHKSSTEASTAASTDDVPMLDAAEGKTPQDSTTAALRQKQNNALAVSQKQKKRQLMMEQMEDLEAKIQLRKQLMELDDDEYD